jgi:hypothetical protein
MKIEVTFGAINNAHAWDEFCEKYGINYYCMNEGLADSDDTTSIELTDAIKWEIVKVE